MPTVSEALRVHGPAVMDSLSLTQQKVISAITRCRTGALGGVHYRCDGCGRDHWVGRSCGNRHCTTCGHEKTQLWIEKQSARLMPVHHFLVTFTVPRELGLVLRAGNDDTRRAGYRCLFDASSQSIRDVGAATKSLTDCQLGFFGVLHTWGRDPQTFHPHIHYVVPGGGVKLDSSGRAQCWQSTPKNFLFHHGTLMRVYKAKLADELRDCGLYDHVPQDAWRKDAVGDIQSVGDGTATLKYLAPYVHRVAISDKRIVSVDEASVTYTIRPTKTKRTTVKTVSGETFVQGFAQHTLPSGFMKIRHYGWMSANSKTSVEEVKWLVWLFLGWTFWLASGHAPAEPSLTTPLRCTECGDMMRVVEVTYEAMAVRNDHALAYFDSG
ncbi:putative transposase [Crateriforma conspicua]|uniref:Putative transposase n=1 Tax=Crateriforma conspicua TaxID=2527996 RepID=A0A5C6FDL7_9PLAN|nr:transposase [Crateriforma conspicua]TWU59515.1 putative transposase [Crateriforma conspicua]